MARSSAHPDATREFHGAEGAARLSLTGTEITPIGPGEFRARVDSFRLDRTRITSVQMTSHRAVARARVGSVQDDTVLIYFLLVGLLIGNNDGRATRDAAGMVRFVRLAAPLRYVAEGPSHAVSWWAKLGDFQPEVAVALRHATWIEFGESHSAKGAMSVIRAILDVAPEPGSSDAKALESVLIGLVEAAVMSADTSRIDPNHAERKLYDEIRALFTADPSRSSLGVPALAQTLGVSPQVLVRVLIAQGTTGRELMTEIRLDSLAQRLRDPLSTDSLTELASAAGFAGLTQATRAFKKRFGMTMGRYRMTMLAE